MANRIKLFTLSPGQEFRISDKNYKILRYIYKKIPNGRKTMLYAINSKNEKILFRWDRNVYSIN